MVGLHQHISAETDTSLSDQLGQGNSGKERPFLLAKRRFKSSQKRRKGLGNANATKASYSSAIFGDAEVWKKSSGEKENAVQVHEKTESFSRVFGGRTPHSVWKTKNLLKKKWSGMGGRLVVSASTRAGNSQLASKLAASAGSHGRRGGERGAKECNENKDAREGKKFSTTKIDQGGLKYFESGKRRKREKGQNQEVPLKPGGDTGEMTAKERRLQNTTRGVSRRKESYMKQM